MKLDNYDIATLKSIANGIEKTLEITDLYLDSNDLKELNKIIKLLEKKKTINKITVNYNCSQLIGIKCKKYNCNCSDKKFCFNN